MSNMTIWKYPLRSDTCGMRLPIDAEILCVQTQNEEPFLWVMLDKDKPLIYRKVMVYETGHNIPDTPQQYIGTFQLHNGSLVFHVFEELKNDQSSKQE